MPRKRILIVEDVGLVREALLEHLADMFPEWEFKAVSGVNEAQKVIPRFNPEAILLDYVLLNGTAEEILSSITVPAVLATGYVNQSMFEDLARRCPSKLVFLPKPYNREELRNALLEALGGG